jgi:hypothetical protein
VKVADLRRTDAFDRDAASAPQDVFDDATAALTKLLQNPHANALRLHSMSGFPKPTIFKMDVRPDKSWQITLELDGQTAVLLRLATHKQIDRRPR